MAKTPKELIRCPWPADDALMVAYHDEEWGVPVRDGKALFAKLMLDGFQAGLSWRTILHKREAFLKGFHQFDPLRVSKLTEKDVTRLLGDAGIIRHRGKIEATIANAKAWLEIEEQEGFSKLLWSFVDDQPVVNKISGRGDVATETAASQAMSKELRARGMKFVGPTIVYAFMQAVGMVDDHLDDCFRKKQLKTHRSGQKA
jgi:DNA-3-methyladenine glycosylase I